MCLYETQILSERLHDNWSSGIWVDVGKRVSENAQRK